MNTAKKVQAIACKIKDCIKFGNFFDLDWSDISPMYHEDKPVLVYRAAMHLASQVTLKKGYETYWPSFLDVIEYHINEGHC